MKRYDDLVSDALTRVKEVMPWDLKKMLSSNNEIFLMDVRERSEFSLLHIPGSINVPRGILEQSCEWDYDETMPELASRRDLEIVVICRSGKRSVLAADVLLQMGFVNAVSLRTGVRGWNDYEQPLRDASGKMLDPDEADALLAPNLRSDQRAPKLSR
ncbi:MAG: rhodanese-like domain-containing protein [Gallionella sp.]|nr:rhodanese-like domain-containing protein [Gallionella sp.]